MDHLILNNKNDQGAVNIAEFTDSSFIDFKYFLLKNRFFFFKIVVVVVI